MKKCINFNGRIIENMSISDIVELRNYCNELIIEKKEELGKEYIQKLQDLIEDAYTHNIYLKIDNKDLLDAKITYSLSA